jgi:hypothetical protein
VPSNSRWNERNPARTLHHFCLSPVCIAQPVEPIQKEAETNNCWRLQCLPTVDRMQGNPARTRPHFCLSPVCIAQNCVLAMQMFGRGSRVMEETFADTTSEPTVLDLKQRTSDNHRMRTRILPGENLTVYVNKKHISLGNLAIQFSLSCDAVHSTWLKGSKCLL